MAAEYTMANGMVCRVEADGTSTVTLPSGSDETISDVISDSLTVKSPDGTDTATLAIDNNGLVTLKNSSGTSVLTADMANAILGLFGTATTFGYTSGINLYLTNSAGTKTIGLALGFPTDLSSTGVAVQLGSSNTLSSGYLSSWNNNSNGSALAVATMDYLGKLTANGGVASGEAALTTLLTGTGITAGVNGNIRRGLFTVTLSRTNFVANATTQDQTLAVIPAKYRITGAIMDTTTKFIGGGLTSATLRLGTSAGGVEIVASHDVFAAAVTAGLADADMGTGLTRAASIQGGYMPSWSATSNLTVRMTTNAAMGSGTVTNFTQGSCKIYVFFEALA